MYNKLFGKILDSSIWLETSETRVVWLTFLAAMDEDGFAHFAALANLAHRARVSIEDARLAVECLENPDPNSSDPANDGRRIERVPGGWMVLNAEKYRDIVTRAVSRERTKERVRRHRQSKKDVTPCNADVTPCNASPKNVTQSVSDTEAVSNTELEATPLVELHSTDDVKKSPKKENSSKKCHPDARTVLFFLNEESGRQFREVDSNLKIITERLNESGVDLEGVKKMILRQVKRWKGTDREEYLRPETLFRASKFDGYYAAKDLPINSGDNGKGMMDPHGTTGITQEKLDDVFGKKQ